MKISTLALGALISFSINTFAQDKPKKDAQVKQTKHTKNRTKTKCVKPKQNLVVGDSLLLEEPKRSGKYCPNCGRG